MERTLDEVTIYVKTVKEICEKKFLDNDESQCEKCSLKRIEEILGMR